MSDMGNSGLSTRQRRRESADGGGVRDGEENGSLSQQQCPSSMEIFIDPDSHQIRVVRLLPSGGGSSNSGDGGRVNISSDPTDGHIIIADENDECLEEVGSDSSDGVMVLGGGADGERRRGSSEEEEEEGEEDAEHLLPSLRFLSRLLGGRRIGRRLESERPLPPATPMDPKCDLYSQVLHDSGRANHPHYASGSDNICSKLATRQFLPDMPTPVMKVSTTVKMLPEHPCLADAFGSRGFCGTYSKDGSIFISSTQNTSIYLYNTAGTNFKRYKCVCARDVGWSILDTDMSADQQWFVYSTWSPCVHVCNVCDSEEEKHYSLDLMPHDENRFCAFAARFSNDGNEIVASASDGFLYVYNRDRCERTLRIDAHQDDANAVSFADASSNIIASGGDDGICKVWDRRTLSEANPFPVGFFAGHKDGITFIDSKGDGRYLISNSKDQSIKLWDLRKFSTAHGERATLNCVRKQVWDYRWEDVPMTTHQDILTKLAGDTSVMTYAGHTVKNTLLRCRFSPMFTTGQSYIYAACARGRVLIYDLLTGKVVRTLKSRNCFGCIRDVFWHPTEPGELVATSWDGVLQMWTYKPRTDYISNYKPRQRALFEW